MKILISPHSMEIGGSQLNAIELAEVMQLREHEIVLYGPRGVLTERAVRSGMEVISAPKHSGTPTVASSARLCRIVRDRSVDLVHAYEWSTIIDAMYGPGWIFGTPVIGTVLSMDVPHFIPSEVPLILGTQQLCSEESWRRPDVHLIEPPIDTELNSPCSPELTAAARARWRVTAGELLIVVVCRLTTHLKLEGLLSAIDVIGARSDRHKERLLVVGGGPSEEIVRAAAEDVNRRARREVITLTGELNDPRAAYRAADIVIGMGGSALKGMAFAKPLIVQGGNGFWDLLDETTLPLFQWQGWYGTGTSATVGKTRLSVILDQLQSPSKRVRLGALGRRTITDHYSLKTAADDLEEIYEAVARRQTSRVIRGHQMALSATTLAKRTAYKRAPEWLRERRARI